MGASPLIRLATTPERLAKLAEMRVSPGEEEVSEIIASPLRRIREKSPAVSPATVVVARGVGEGAAALNEADASAGSGNVLGGEESGARGSGARGAAGRGRGRTGRGDQAAGGDTAGRQELA